ncbi:type II secretion system protein GspD [Roseateles sp. DB2]|uniref:type II secretion system protein GspD n=1 Tax=Roseateles sp. DB2 TaxID=3453717 RepID=UPI003EEEB5E6
MKSCVLALALLVGHPIFASAKSADLSFELSGVQVGRIVNVIYSDALKTPYVLAPELLADQRLVSFRFAGSVQSIKADLIKLLDSLGYAVTDRGGLEFLGPKRDPEPALEAFVYKPRFRDVGYLADLLRPLFKGQFTVNRTVVAPLTSKTDVPMPPGSAAALVDRAADVLVFSGEAGEVKKLERLLAQVDCQVGEVMVRGVVYEVQTGDSTGSAFNLAASLLAGRLSVNLQSTAQQNSVRVSVGNADAVFSALSSDSRFKVVTQPALRVRSGAQASFAVGQDVPVLGAVTYVSNGQPVQSVEYRNSGVIFNVTPQVREGAIDLAVQQQISNFVPTTTGVNNSPTLIKRELKTDVQVRDGEIVMLGGLTEEKSSAGRSGLSFLPGWAQTRTGERGRTELLLVLQLTRAGLF